MTAEGLPFLTALAPSERHTREHGRRHKKLTDWDRQVLLQTARWLPERRIVGVADSSFAEVRRHLGVETQRQWTDPAIARTTPVLLALFSRVVLWANDLQRERPLLTRTASWYPKKLPTCADALAAVRTELWRGQGFRTSRQPKDVADIHPDTLNRLIDLACYAA